MKKCLLAAAVVFAAPAEASIDFTAYYEGVTTLYQSTQWGWQETSSPFTGSQSFQVFPDLKVSSSGMLAGSCDKCASALVQGNVLTLSYIYLGGYQGWTTRLTFAESLESDLSNLATAALVSGTFSASASGLSASRIWTGTATTAFVPEPGTWAMMIGGLGLAGAALRRRYAASRIPAAKVAASNA